MDLKEFGCLKSNKTLDIDPEPTEPIIENIVTHNRRSTLFGRLEAREMIKL